MKKNLMIAFVLMQFTVFAQENNFTLQGIVENLNTPATIYLRYQQKGKSLTDSIVLKNGEFVFKGNVGDPTRASLQLVREGYKLGSRLGNDGLALYLEPGNITIKRKDSIKFATISGSKINDENARLQAASKALDEKRQQMQVIFKGLTPESMKDTAIRAKVEKFSAEYNALQKQVALNFLQENPDSWLCFEQLRTVGGYQPDVKVVEPIFNSLSERLRNTTAGKAYAANIAKWHTIANGMTAPDFTQNDPDGKPVKLSNFRGKYVLLDFWASWCGPCRAENPHVVAAYNQYKDRNFTILSVSLDKEDAREAWLAAIKKDNLTWNHVSDLKYWRNDAAVLYTIQAIPDNFLIGPDGKILARGLRGDALTSKLAELLK